jgi:GNAT superfamily N-acetyltransferase
MHRLFTMCLLLPLAWPGSAPAAAAVGNEVAEIRSVARSFVAALYDGDLARAERQAYAGTRERDVIEAMSLTLSSDARLAAAVDERFGWCKESDPCTLANAAAALARADGRVSGDVAEIGAAAAAAGATTLPMRWTGDGWKVDVIALARRRGVGRELLPRACQRAAEVDQRVSEIEAGKYTSVAEVLDADDTEATASIQE